MFVEDEDDVVACVKFVDKYHLDVAVAGGRHFYHGASSSEGLVIGMFNPARSFQWCVC